MMDDGRLKQRNIYMYTSSPGIWLTSAPMWVPADEFGRLRIK